MCIATLFFYARYQLDDEQEPRIAAAREVVAALNHTLEKVSDPGQVLAAFAASLQAAESLDFEGAGSDPSAAEKVAQKELATAAPGWFIGLLKLPDLTHRFPVVIRGERVGDIVFQPNMASDVSEKWDVFVELIVASALLALLAVLLTSRMIAVTMTPLDDIASGLKRLQAGDYSVRLNCGGSPEIVAGCQHLNDLAETLGHLTADNQRLLRRMVVLQDEERREIARELHDELGPLLFAIRANTTALLQDAQEARTMAGGKVLEAVEALQQTNRRILNRLRPMHVQELGLPRSIEGLARDAERQSAALEITTMIDPGVAQLDTTLAETIYRLVDRKSVV